MARAVTLRIALGAALAAALVVGSCDDLPTNPDGTGACSPDDTFEENDLITTAAPLAVGSHQAVLCGEGHDEDADFYSFTGRPGRGYRLRIENTAASTGWSVLMGDAATGTRVTVASDGGFTLPASGRVIFQVEATPASLDAGRSYRVSITLPNRAPTVAFTFSPSQPEFDRDVTFTASVSDPDGDSIAARNWRFGDGGTAAGAVVTHRFAAGGTYTVWLVATDEFGARDSSSVAVPVSALAAVVEVTPGAVDLGSLGDTLRLTAVARDRSGRALAGKTFTWASSSAAVATVTADGLVRAVGNGAATITVQADTAHGTATVRVAQQPATLVIEPAAAALTAIGQSVRFSATGQDARGHPLVVTDALWTSSSEAVATISADGTATARGNGSATITASVGALRATAALTVAQRGVRVLVTPPTDTLDAVGDTLRLSARVEDELGVIVPGAAVTWSSSSPALQVSADGLVRGLKPGHATITATTGDAHGQAFIAVVPRVARLLLTPEATSARPGQQVHFTAMAYDRHGRPLPTHELPWHSSDTAVAATQGNGYVLAKGEGTATITVSSGSLSASASLLVADGTANDFEVFGNGQSGTAGLPLPRALGVRVLASGEPIAGVAVTFATASGGSISPATIVTDGDGWAWAVWRLGPVNGLQTATATAPGLPVIPFTATASGGETPYDFTRVGNAQSDTVGATLAQPVGVIVRREGALLVGEAVTFTVLGGGGAVDRATVETDDTGYAGVTWMLGPSVGTQTLAATIGGATVVLDASALPGALVRIVAAPAALTFASFGDTATVVATAEDAYGNAIPGAFTWLSTQPLVASSDGGQLTALANGSTLLIVSRSGVADTTTVLVRQVVATLSLSQPEELIEVGDTVRFRATLRDARGHLIEDLPVSWLSTDTEVATVAAGLVTGVGPGTTTIRATAGAITAAGELAVEPAEAPTVLFFEYQGNLQVGYAGEPAPDSVVIIAYGDQVCHADGCEPSDPVPGATVYLRAGRGTLERATVVTDANGRAAFRYTLGGALGGDTLRAWIPGAQARTGWSSYADTAFLRFHATDRVDAREFVQVSASPESGNGAAHTCALTDDGIAYCWGDNNWGQLGMGSSDWEWATIPVRIGGELRFTDISAGGYHTCAVATDGRAYCWGDTDYIGVNEGDFSSELPVAVETAEHFTRIAAGTWTTCGITTAGRLHCWGDGAYGALGNGTTSWAQTPVPSSSTLTFTDVAMGTIFYGCAIATGGDAWCWGANSSGQLGDGTRNERHDPVRVVGGHSFTQITAQEDHTCALATDGSAWCWGYNGDGVLGNGTESVMGSPYWNPEPVLVLGGMHYRSISAGLYHTCAVATVGTLWCWGYNGDGQFGVGSATPEESHSPMPAAPGLSFARVSAGATHTCGLQASGTLYCWGENAVGQAGSRSADRYLYTPTRIGSGFAPGRSGSADARRIAPAGLSLQETRAGAELLRRHRERAERGPRTQ